ncbi:MAG: hypothetical protein D6690_01740 [Nitrospirae bacterium]|nr:MAG: hypothetical protein D6690_01740 [Nitrospirota bacterium]
MKQLESRIAEDYTAGVSRESDGALDIQRYVRELLQIAVRWKWWILGWTLVGTAVAGVYAWTYVPVYRSTTVILVEQQTIPRSYVDPVVGGTVAERISTITQQVLSRTNLEKVINEFGLYQDLIKEKGYDAAIENMRKIVKLTPKGSGGRLETFTISYAHSDPMVAMKVTEKLASQYIEENLKLREEFVEGAAEFLEEQLAIAKRELDEKERALSEFKLKYMGELPGQLEANLRALDRLQLEKASIQETLNNLTMRLELVQKSMHEYQSVADFLASDPVSPGGGEPTATPLEVQLRTLEQQLAKLKLEYTDSYPDVIDVRNKIDKIKQQLAQRKLEASSQQTEASSSSETEQVEGVKYDPYLQELMATRDEIKLQIAAHRDRLRNVTKQMEEISGRIERTPEREQELLKLERDYASLRKNYEQLINKRLSSRISEHLEKRQKGERFRILDPANLPTTPEGLPPYLFVIAGCVVGCGIGYGSAFLIEQLHPTFRRAEDIEVAVGIPMLATIPSFRYAYGKSLRSLPSRNAAGSNGHEKSGAKSEPSKVVSYFGKTLAFGRIQMLPVFDLVTKWFPGTIVAEQYRVAATRLTLIETPTTKNAVVLITSAVKGDGKTATIANLGYTLARDLEESTLIIDCDLKAPRVHEVFGIPLAPGLAEYFAGEEPLERCLHRIDDLKLAVLPAGHIADRNLALSKLPRLEAMLELLKPQYEYILLDSPPFLTVADVNVLATFADIVLLVVRAGTTPRDVVSKAMNLIPHGTPARIILADAWSQGMPYYVKRGYEVPYAIGERA